jgi:hypothetical protein
MSGASNSFRYHRSPIQDPYPYKDSEQWGTFVRYVELGDDGFAIRQVDEFENGNLSRYDRAHWDDQFGTLANFRFGEAWIQHWGTPHVITRQEFEEKWARAVASPLTHMKQAPPQSPPPWIKP